ncbi:TetR/AcrR family transcriptional regulator [Streptomyces sp. URMC 123]|uniref:TetR/AcrR family transcriptional regulator n=1 Tax=Streptomyces sp. URMC 123 TaxID=3423403 RepID=UPI003F1B01CD
MPCGTVTSEVPADAALAAPVSACRPRLRADAARNRERIVSAARELFVARGAEVPLDEVARRAGVGNATLYRHFPDRDELIHQVSLQVMDRVVRQARAALDEEPDAFAALSRFAHAAVDERIGALCTLLSGRVDRDHPELVEARDQLERVVESLMEGARASGLLRGDVAAGDVLVAITQLTRPLPDSGCRDIDGFAHRHLQLLLDGLRAPARSELPGAPVTLEDLRRQALAENRS